MRTEVSQTAGTFVCNQTFYGLMHLLAQPQWEGVRGGNMAYFREDLERIDGFDASYVGWGPEDSDVVIRMIRSGELAASSNFPCSFLTRIVA